VPFVAGGPSPLVAALSLDVIAQSECGLTRLGNELSKVWGAVQSDRI